MSLHPSPARWNLLPRIQPPGSARILPAALWLVIALAGLMPGAAFADTSNPPSTSGAAGLSRRVRLPFIVGGRAGVHTGTVYEAIPVEPPPTDRPATEHADLNLALRGYRPTEATLALTGYGGDTDGLAPQLPGIFADRRTPQFTSAYQVYDWVWTCDHPEGCRGNPLSNPAVTLLGMATRPGELLSSPSRPVLIYGGGYTALVLYADEGRLTLKYTREDNVIGGYTVHLENFQVDQDLLALYRKMDAAGRGELPALKNGQPLGVASGGEVLVSIRDCGTFMDPRSGKDWWQGR